MTRKINLKLPYLAVAFLLILLLYTRFFGINWGLPYPMNPDERNMANAIQSLTCPIQSSEFRIQNCFNPHFFAYGQLPLYFGYILVQVYHLFSNKLGNEISFTESILSLRLISAIASMLNVFILLKIINLLIVKEKFTNRIIKFLTAVLFIFSPGLIQFAHFGTTESLLMLFYSVIIYICLLYLERKILNFKFLILSSFVCGLAIATKVSALIFITGPLLIFAWRMLRRNIKIRQIRKWISGTFIFISLTTIICFIFSPFNFLDLNNFLGSLQFESGVALGKISVFYTRQFTGTIPVLFQFQKIFPYSLGWPVLILFIFGFLFLPWNKKINFLRIAFLIYFLPTAFEFTKWTRFMAPIFPLMLVISCLFLVKLYQGIKNIWLLLIIVFIAVIPGVAYLSIYQNPDVRLTASGWIYENIPADSFILSETANVVDLPIFVPGHPTGVPYKYVSFDFYDLDNDPLLQLKLAEYLKETNYIFVPSRRIFLNHPKEEYPVLAEYYSNLFSGKLGFKKIAEFNSFPTVCFPATKLCWVSNDEGAEETWTVFDHPVIRIFKKTI